MGFVADIRKRRLFQIVAAYAAAGFVVLQGVDQLVQHEMLPAFAYPLAVWWYGIGFIGALVIGWFHGEKGAQKAPLSEIVTLSVLGVVLLGLTGAQVNAHLSDQRAHAAAATSELDLRTVAVTYFEDLGPDGENRDVADGLTEDLIRSLSGVRALNVISRNGVLPYRGANTRVDGIAQALEAGTVVTGGVEALGDVVRINVRLHDGESGTEFRRRTLEVPADDLLEAREELTEETARFLREWLGEEIRPRQRERDTEHLDAWRLVQRGEATWQEAERLVREGAPIERALEAFEEADDLLERAETVDPSWTEPAALRARVAFRRAQETAVTLGPQAAEPVILGGIEHAERALAVDPNHAGAIEQRGSLRYLWHLLPLVADPDDRERLFEQARQDLEEARRLDPTLASVHSTLSHLYAYDHQMSSSLLAAERAYEEDAYLRTADDVVWRLTTGYYDQEVFWQSNRWCEEGARRFPEDHRFAQCRLLLMTTEAVDPDPGLAWELLALVDSLAPAAARAVEHAKGMVYLGGVLARAELPDSADAVLERARERVPPEADLRGDVLLHEAAMRATVLDDHDGAMSLLETLAARDPDFYVSDQWWWRELRGLSGFEQLAARGRSR